MVVPLKKNTVDGRNPANQLRVVVYPTIIFRVLYIPGGCLGFLPSTVFANVLPLKD